MDRKVDPLVLAYSTLGSKVSMEVKQSIVQFLKQKLLQETEDIEKVHMLHAFGNIDCNESLAIILYYVDDDDLNVKMAATFALRKHISNPVVRRQLKHALRDDEMLETVFEVLITGIEYVATTVSKQIYQEKKHEIEEDIIESLVNALSSISAISNTTTAVKNLQLRVCAYIESSLPNSLEKDRFNAQLECDSLALKIKKRGTDWDEDDSNYDIVSPLSERQSDVTNYHHKAYIRGKKFGVSDLNLQFGIGAFVGLSKNISSEFKIFARAVATVNVLGRSKTFVDAKLLATRKNETKYVVYVSLVGDVLVNIDDRVATNYCLRREWPIYQRRVKISSFQIKVFIYVGYLKFSLDVYAQFRLTSRVFSCSVENGVQLSGALVPGAGISAVGSATATLVVSLFLNHYICIFNFIIIYYRNWCEEG